MVTETVVNEVKNPTPVYPYSCLCIPPRHWELKETFRRDAPAEASHENENCWGWGWGLKAIRTVPAPGISVRHFSS